MAARVGGVAGGSRYVASSTYSPIVPLPTILATTDDTPANSSTLVLTVANASIVGNAVFLTDGDAVVEQVIIDEYENEILITVDRGAFKYGADLSLYLIDAEYLQGPNYTIQLMPQTGWGYVDLVSLADPADRLEADPDLAIGDQVAWDTKSGIVFVRDDASYYATAGGFDSFDVEAWSPGEGWGEVGAQSLYVEIPAEITLLTAVMESSPLTALFEAGVEPAFDVGASEITPLDFIVTSGTEIPADLAFDIATLEITSLDAAPTSGHAVEFDIAPNIIAPLDSLDESGHDLSGELATAEITYLPFSVSAGQPVDLVFDISALAASSLAGTIEIGQQPTMTVSGSEIAPIDAVTETGNDIQFVRSATVIYPIQFHPEIREADAVEQSFRRRYPEFADYDRWPYELVSQALCDARGEIGCRWGKYAECSLHQRGLFAYTAHWLVMREAARKTALAGAIPSTPGRVSSKTVGGESVSYQMGQYASYSAGDDALATTIYGAEFLRLRKRAGMGAVAI
jgi:hypothetical protein